MSDDLLTILYDPRSISEKCRLISMHGNGRNTTKFETIQIPDHHVWVSPIFVDWKEIKKKTPFLFSYMKRYLWAVYVFRFLCNCVKIIYKISFTLTTTNLSCKSFVQNRKITQEESSLSVNAKYGEMITLMRGHGQNRNCL